MNEAIIWCWQILQDETHNKNKSLTSVTAKNTARGVVTNAGQPYDTCTFLFWKSGLFTLFFLSCCFVSLLLIPSEFSSMTCLEPIKH